MKKYAVWIVGCFFSITSQLIGQQVIVLHKDSFNTNGRMPISTYDGWLFAPGNDPSWANPDTDTNDWIDMNPTALSVDLQDDNGRIEGWFPLRAARSPARRDGYHDGRLADVPLRGRRRANPVRNAHARHERS